ncbi:energy-coupling factor transporter transmembrane component T family protein [Acrocarpospora catenulata]|uniref:energy-coupling factor transporter transmembrane component T family protein n=1 Tax=Acrocarpospora catenulata TaxID=2836182 RepID=UPI001BD94EBA|nr:energy-coupling factor transporter transmembrane component T [Acrocarpospora catenulata]
MTAGFDFQGTAERHRPPLGQVNPLVLVVGILLPALTSLAITTPASATVSVLLLLALLPLLRSPRRSMLPRLVLAGYLILTIFWNNWYFGGQDEVASAVAAARVFCVAMPGLLLSAHVRPFELGDALIQQLRLPPRPVLTIVMALQRTALLTETWTEIGHVRRSRGLGGTGVAGRVRELAGRCVVFLTIALRSATDLAVAIEVRGMLAWEARGVARGHWQRSRWTRRDSCALALVALFSAVPVATAFL